MLKGCKRGALTDNISIHYTAVSRRFHGRGNWINGRLHSCTATNKKVLYLTRLAMDNVTNPWLANAGTQRRCGQCGSILLDTGLCLDCADAPATVQAEVGQASRGACQLGMALAKGCKWFMGC